MDNEGLDSSRMQTNILGKKIKILRGTEQGSCPEAGIKKMQEEGITRGFGVRRGCSALLH